MPFNETAVYMEKHNKHDTSTSGSSRESKLSSPTVSCMGKPIDNPLIKYQGCKWEQIFDFDKVLKQIRNAERYYIRGKHDTNQSGGSKSGTCSFPRREQPQVQRLSSNDMHFYGMVPKQPFDVVVCDKCLGIYTKMGFNNHMKLHHPQAWNMISSKASISKDSGHSAASSGSDNFQDNIRELSASTNLLTEQQASNAIATTSTTASNSRHKSSKSSSGGGSSRSRSKSKHHHHHHQQQQQRSVSASATTTVSSSHTSQTSTTNAEVSTGNSNTKSSKKTTSVVNNVESKLNGSVSVPKEMQQADIQSIPIFSSSSSNSSNSLPPTLKISADMTGAQQDSVYSSTQQVSKEKPKASKRKSKNISVAPLSLPPPESNESSNSSIEYAAAMAAAAAASASAASNSTAVKSSSKRPKPKSGKDLKQLLEPQLTELDKAISSITGGQTDVSNEASNSNDNDCIRNLLTGPKVNNSTAMSYSTEVDSLPMQVQVPLTSTRIQQQPQQQPQYGSMPMLPESTNNINQIQLQQHQNSNAEDNDNSILMFEDMLDSKFIHEILNTDESEIHFDESELDKAAQQQQQQQQQQQPQLQQSQQQQQQQQAYLQPTVSKRMRFDEPIGNSMENVDNIGQQPSVPGKYAAFQQQQQQQTQQAFHVTNLEDIKMYTTAIDAQQYLTAQQHQTQPQQQQQEQNQITTIDPIQLQQLLYQQQQQQGLNAYTVSGGLDEVTTALEQHRYNDSDVIMCSAEQLHKEGKINAADYATLAALSGNNNTYGSVTNNVCDINAMAAAAQFQVYNIPSLTDDDVPEEGNIVENKLNDVMLPQNTYMLPAEGNDEEQLIYEITANNQVSVISQQRQQQMIAEFLTQAGYDNVDNVNVNLSSGGILTADANESKYSMSDGDINNDILDFDYSRLETVKSCSSSSSGSSSAEPKGGVKVDNNCKYISPNNIGDDLFLNVFLYAGLPRPMAVNCFGLCKLPQGVATTFRKNLHATRKANNSPISLNGNGGGASTTRFASNVPNAKPNASQNYFTALGSGTNAGNVVNEFSIGSITITNQGHQTPNNANFVQHQQQLTTQKQALMVQTPVELTYGASNSNGLIATASNTASSPVSSIHASVNSRSSRPKSAGSVSNSSSSAKQKFTNSSSSSSNSAALLPLPQNQAKTIIVNANNADQAKFIKRSLISKTNLPPRNSTNFTAKQLSEMLLHPSKEKYMQLLTSRDPDKDSVGSGMSPDQQRLNNVRNFYERRKRLLNASANSSTASSFNQVNRQSNSQQTMPTAAAGLNQKFLRQHLLRTLSDCGINSIKSNSNSANNSSNNDILRVS